MGVKGLASRGWRERAPPSSKLMRNDKCGMRNEAFCLSAQFKIKNSKFKIELKRSIPHSQFQTPN